MSLEIVRHHARQISAIRSGEGPLIVLLPPGASSASAWRNVSEILSPRFECLAINPSGYGDTEAFPSDQFMTLDDEAEAVLAFMVNREGAVHLVGHSYGGAVAIRLALEDASRFSSLTLIEPALYPLLAQAGEHSLAGEVEAINRSFIARVQSGDDVNACQDYFDFYNGRPGEWSKLPASARQRLLGVAKPVAAALAAVHAWECKLGVLGDLMIPTLVVSGAETDRVHARLTEIIAERVPGARHEIIPNAGHMCSLTHPVELAELIQSHVVGAEKRHRI